jgi:SAM-dependent methyltransferase
VKAPETNPRVATQNQTPKPADETSRGDDGGRGQVPISVSEGDFSTPVQRKRTITRPRGLKTLEQLRAPTPPEPLPVVERTPEAIPAAAPEQVSGHEASAVDEFLAAPPTPEPEVVATPVPEVVTAPSVDAPEVAADTAWPAEVALAPSEEASSPEATPDEGASVAGDSGVVRQSDGAPAPNPDQAMVDSLIRQASAALSASHSGELVIPDGLSFSESAGSDGEVSVLVAPSVQVTMPETVDAVPAHPPVSDAPVEPSASPAPAVDGTDLGLSPLAQTLANIAEAMQGELAGDSALDIDIIDAPLVPPPPPMAVGAGRAGERPFPVPALVGLPEALAERPRRPKRSKPWFEEVFDESYLRTLPFMTAEQTLREVDFIESSLAVPKGSDVLDVACGYGRHAIELVQRGLAVTGLDLSLPLLIRAADESQRRAVSVNFVHTDMREMPFDRQFAGAYCMLTSFGYFDEESNLKVAEGIARALKPGGRFLVDVINRDYIVGDLPARIWWEGDGCVVLEEVDFNFNTNRVLTHRSVVFEDGQQLEQEISLRVYSLHEMGKLLRQAGFRVIEVSGSIPTRGHFFGANSRNLLILAERRMD